MSNNTTETEAELRSELETLKNDLLAVKRDIGGVTSAAVEQGREMASTVRDEATDRLDRGVQSTRDCVRENPIASAAIAAGVGFLAGVLMSRK